MSSTPSPTLTSTAPTQAIDPASSAIYIANGNMESDLLDLVTVSPVPVSFLSVTSVVADKHSVHATVSTEEKTDENELKYDEIA